MIEAFTDTVVTAYVGAFFTLIYISAQLLQTSIASMVMATSPIAMLLLAWLIVAERPRAPAAVGAVVGIAGRPDAGGRLWRDRPARCHRLRGGDDALDDRLPAGQALGR
jgi:hypothetical protein